VTARSGVVWILGLALCSCSGQPTVGQGSGAQPATISWIGPVPGHDVATVAARNPYSGDRSAIADGYRYFNSYNCAGCHGDHGGGGMGPSLRDSSWIYGGADASVFSSIYQGRDYGMPAWGTKLSPEQIWKLVTYIKSMRTANEMNPPH
jgi:cbb3-type cytochrome c oxidase subunit III